jgi:hypothetical protein
MGELEYFKIFRGKGLNVGVENKISKNIYNLVPKK